MRIIALAVAVVLSGSIAHASAHGERAVTIASASDASPGVLAPAARKRHGAIVRQAMLDVLRRAGVSVGHAGARQLDVAVIAWRIVPRAGTTDVTAELRVVVCDGHGKMLAIVSGRATVSGSSAQLTSLREQALAEAVGGMTRTLRSQLAPAVG